MNRILTDAARKRTERIKELEDQLAQFERQMAHLKQELETARKAIERARELDAVAAQRADLLNEKDKELAVEDDWGPITAAVMFFIILAGTHRLR